MKNPYSLQGAANFRDLGGYRTAGGGQVRRGLVFRSGALHQLTAADLATLGRIGLRVVYDLRSDDEREHAQSMLPGPVRCEPLPVLGAAARTAELAELIAGGKLGDIPADFLSRVYASMTETAAPVFGQLLTRLTEPDGLPALFHCTAGKDRTGLCAVLLLSVLGVDEAAILDDYELSARYYTDRQLARLRVKLAGTGIDAERYRAIFGAPRPAMATLLDTLRARYGGVEAYLADQAGVARDVVTELRARLVEPAAAG